MSLIRGALLKFESKILYYILLHYMLRGLTSKASCAIVPESFVPPSILLQTYCCKSLINSKLNTKTGSHPLWQAGRGVALVGRDNLATLDLDVGVGGPDNELLRVVDNGKSGETVTRAKLTAPAGCDRVRSASDRASGGLRGLFGRLDNVFARCGSGEMGVDSEGPSA